MALFWQNLLKTVLLRQNGFILRNLLKTVVWSKIILFWQKLHKTVWFGQNGYILAKAAQNNSFGQNSLVFVEALQNCVFLPK